MRKTTQNHAKPRTFSKKQLLGSKALGVAPDVAAAALREGRAYTVAQAKKEVEAYLNRKV